MTSCAWKLALTAGLCAVLAGCGDDLKQQNAQLKTENEQLQSKLSEKERELTDAEARYAQARTELNSKDQEVTSLQQQLRDALAKKPLTPTAPEGWEIKGGVAMISVADDVLFDSGKATIKPSAKPVLDKIVGQIKTNFPGKEVLVIGHTDAEKITKSKWTDNWELSAERGLAVSRFLLGAGIPGSKIVAAGCGQYRPKVPNPNNGRESKNRRVEILVYEPSTR